MKYPKAIVGAALAAIAYAIPVIDDGLILSEMLSILAAFLTGYGVVWITPYTAGDNDA